MDTDRQFIHKELTGEIIAGAFNVHNTLGCGLLEKVYENALAWELELMGKKISSQKEFKVMYRDKEVGFYYADLIVDKKVIVEVKVVEALDKAHRAQLLNYLKIAGLRVGLLLNFALPRLEYERLIL
jgi:GxxExxY protein